MTGPRPKKPRNLPQTVDLPFLITASELRDRKTKRQRKQPELPSHFEAIRRPVELGLKAKGK
jgi:hypothetical protein